MRGSHALVAGALVVAVLAALLLLVLGTRTSLEAADATTCPEGSRTARLDEAGRTEACTVVNTDTRDVTFGIVVRNPGTLPLTVTAVPLQPLDGVGFTPEEIVEGAPPFRLGGGESRQVLLRGQLPACEARTTGGATTFTDLGFHIRTLGVTRNQRVALEPAVRLVSEPC